MKFTINFKTPDAVQYVIDSLPEDSDWESIQKITDKFVEYGEYVLIEFDTDTMKATVLPVK